VPIFTPDQLRELTPGAPVARQKPSPDPIMICTLSDADKGDTCRACGHPSGSGHGKERR
jgi:hypothetical protein